WARRLSRSTSPPSWSSANRVMASTAPLMAASAAGGTPPGSMTTSGRVFAHAAEDMPSQAANQTSRDSMHSALAGDHHGYRDRPVFGQNGHIGRQSARNGMVGLGGFTVRLSDHSGAA